MRARVEESSRPVHVAAVVFSVGLAGVAGGLHVYWLLGGTWGLYDSSGRPGESTTGVRVLAALVIVLVVVGVLVALARVGLWRQAFVSDGVIRVLAWAMALFLLFGEALMAFARREPDWELYGPVALVLGVLALVVAGSGGAWPRLHRPHRTLSSH